jgi:hypothetical protein
MSKLGIAGTTALSLALAVATPAFAAGRGGGAMHVGGGGAMHVGGMGGVGAMHVGGFGGGGAMRIGGVGGMHVGGVGAMHVGGAQANIGAGRVGSVSGGDFTGHDGGQVAHDEHRSDHDRHHGYNRGLGVAAGLAAGSALGYYGYGGYYDPNYSDGYVSSDPGYDGSSDSVVSSDADASYCAQNYSSYDPASGTYLGNDGLVHPCP